MIAREGSDALLEAMVALGRRVRDRVRGTGSGAGRALARPAGAGFSDVQYGLDLEAERGIEEDARALFAPLGGVALLSEGSPDGRAVATGPEAEHVLLVDPIDGTRGLMRGKRSAFFLAGLGPRRAGTLRELTHAVMVEIPPPRGAWSDVLAVRAGGALLAQTEGLLTEEVRAFVPEPDSGRDLRHGFATFARFTGGAQEAIGRLADRFFARLHPDDPGAWSAIFEDQYICNGGQMHALACGQDLLVADLRPLLRDVSGGPLLSSHPYDHAAWRVAAAAGVVLEDPWGAPLDAPLNLDHPVAWVGYASEALAERLRPELQATLREAGLSRG
jgi:hypothetical protein